MSRVFKIRVTVANLRNLHGGLSERTARIVLDAVGEENAPPRRMTVGTEN
jgi:hypothetical protein